jgi:hypothetical protein
MLMGFPCDLNLGVAKTGDTWRLFHLLT